MKIKRYSGYSGCNTTINQIAKEFEDGEWIKVEDLKNALGLFDKSERAEKQIDYSTPTPQTDAFMLMIDDSEVDLCMIGAQLRDMERERDHYKKLVESEAKQ